MSLDDTRKEISDIDAKLVSLLVQRFGLCEEVGVIKRQEKLPILDEKREQEILKRIDNVAPKYSAEIKAVFKTIMQQAKTIE